MRLRNVSTAGAAAVLAALGGLSTGGCIRRTAPPPASASTPSASAEAPLPAPDPKASAALEAANARLPTADG